MEALNARVVVADMDAALQQQIIEQSRKIITEDPKRSERDVAVALRTYLDETLGKAWHVVVGANFGSSVSSLAQKFLYFYLGSVAILAFQTK